MTFLRLPVAALLVYGGLCLIILAVSIAAIQ